MYFKIKKVKTYILISTKLILTVTPEMTFGNFLLHKMGGKKRKNKIVLSTLKLGTIW